MPGAQFQALLGTAFLRYRYFRWTVTDILTGGLGAACYNAQVSIDGGTTWIPTQTMTTDSAPSPLVSSSLSFIGGNEPYHAFDQNGATYWVSTNNTDGAGHFATPEWIQIDLGAGNNLIIPNKFRVAYFNGGGASDLTWKNFTLKASHTGAFAGEENTLKTVSGQTTQVDQANIVYNIP